MPKVKNKTFRFITETEIRKTYFDLTGWQSAQLRAKLPKGIYWLQIKARGLIQWNFPLLQDYLINGDRPEHQALVEEYIATLPEVG